MKAVVDSQSAGSAVFNLGVDCNSDCSFNLFTGTNYYTALSFEATPTVIEIQPTNDSDITLSFVALYAGQSRLKSSTASNTGVSVGPFTPVESKNISIGVASYNGTATGIDNIAVGWNTLTNSTSANSNVAIGANAGYNTQAGAQNVFIGEGAGFLTEAQQNVFIGTEAGGTNSTGSQNVGIGVGAFSCPGTATTGGQNTALGALDGGCITTGNHNTSVGNDVLDIDLKTGSRNVGVGATINFGGGDYSDTVAIGDHSGARANGAVAVGKGVINSDANTVKLGTNSTVYINVTSSSGSAGKAMCWKDTTTLSFCTSVVGVDGSCTCN